MSAPLSAANALAFVKYKFVEPSVRLSVFAIPSITILPADTEVVMFVPPNILNVCEFELAGNEPVSGSTVLKIF